MTEPETFTFADDGGVPNTKLPMLVYRAAVPANPEAIEQLFERNQWPPAWRDGVHPFHHFHSTAHEVLGVARGHGRVLFGGPNGKVMEIGAGDVVVLPAGTGHCRQSASDDLLIVGAYPAGERNRVDLCRGQPEEHDEAVRNIARVPRPGMDPVTGAEGAAVRLWGKHAGLSAASPREQQRESCAEYQKASRFRYTDRTDQAV